MISRKKGYCPASRNRADVPASKDPVPGAGATDTSRVVSFALTRAADGIAWVGGIPAERLRAGPKAVSQLGGSCGAPCG